MLESEIYRRNLRSLVSDMLAIDIVIGIEFTNRNIFRTFLNELKVMPRSLGLIAILSPTSQIVNSTIYTVDGDIINGTSQDESVKVSKLIWVKPKSLTSVTDV